VRALYEAGKYAEALPKAQAVLEEARKVRHPPLDVAAAWHLGRVHGQLEASDEAESLLLEAVAGAEAMADYETAAQIWIDLTYLIGLRAAKLDAGMRFADNAKRDLERAGGNDEIEAQRLHNAAFLLCYQDRFDEALPLFDQALTLLEKTHAGPALVSRTLDARGGFALRAVGRLEEGLALERKAIELSTTAFGPAHPTMAWRWNNLGVVLFEAGEYKEALDSFEASASISKRALGPNYLRIVFPLVAKAEVLLAVEHDGDALAILEQVERVQKEAGKKARPDLQADLEIAYSTYLRRHRQAAKALDHATEALAIAEKTYGPKSANVSTAHCELSRVALSGQRFKDAVSEARQALAIIEALPFPQPLRLEEALLALGEALIAQRAESEAIVVLERARTVGESHKMDRFKLAQVQFSLGKALWESNVDRARARALVKTALETYTKEPLLDTKRTEVAQWISSH